MKISFRLSSFVFAIVQFAAVFTILFRDVSFAKGNGSEGIQIDTIGELWQIDRETASPELGYEHYVFKTDSSIHLLFSKYTGDLLGGDFAALQSQILRGKNVAQSLVSDRPVVMAAFSVKSLVDGGKKVSYETSYEVAGIEYHTLEFLVLRNQQNFQAVLKWNEKSREKDILQSKKSFVEISDNRLGR